jgi:hypothetical protein
VEGAAGLLIPRLGRYAAEPSTKLAKHIAEHQALADLAYSQIRPAPEGTP